ncbi:hypothetical protein [Salinicola tamaricis]|uniref:hypothetical protein n=1 Tax=Salinicola tamaricis TaxID=1771309 RepID=UPI001A90DEA3|nr:hypothetical protein [Salinicola tamaricis]
MGSPLWRWLGLLPFALFVLLFLVLPVLYLVQGAFQTPQGQFTFDNLRALASPTIASAYSLSIRLSLVSAGLGALGGLLVCYALVHGGLPSWLRHAFTTFSGVASNFAGVPLHSRSLPHSGGWGWSPYCCVICSGSTSTPAASAFLLLGAGADLSLFSAAIDAADHHSGDAGAQARVAGGGREPRRQPPQYWRRVALPVLTPSVLSCFMLCSPTPSGPWRRWWR